MRIGSKKSCRHNSSSFRRRLFHQYIPVMVVFCACAFAVFLKSISGQAKITEIKQTDAGYSADNGYYAKISFVCDDVKNTTRYTAYLVSGETEIEIGDVTPEADKNGNYKNEVEFMVTGLKPGQTYRIRVYDENKNYKEKDITSAPGALMPSISFWGYNMGIFWAEFPSVYGADGYQMKAVGSTGKTLKTKNIKAEANKITNSVKFSSLISGKVAGLKLRSYFLLNGEKKYGKWSDIYYFAAPKAATIAANNYKIKIAGLKVSGAAKKVIYISKKKKSGYKKVKTLKKAGSCTITYLNEKTFTPGKTYYVKIYYYYKVGGKTKKSPIIGSGSVKIPKYGAAAPKVSLKHSV